MTTSPEPSTQDVARDPAFGSMADADAAFLRLREVLGAPDRRGWRRWLERIRPSGEAAEADSSGAGESEQRGTRQPRLGVVVALPLLGAAAVLLVSFARSPAPVLPARPSAADLAPPIAASVAAPSTSTPARVWPAEPVRIDGSEVRIGNERWSVGNAGDLVVVGDWDCDRQPTPAVLRPGGRLFVFDDWAAVGEEVTARQVAEISTAVAVSPGGCGAAILRDADGREHRLDLTTAP